VVCGDVKIGVVADTHIPDLMSSLPEQIEEVFRGLDLILHVGDICSLDTLQQLEDNLTITMAVAGERDSPEARRYLEDKKVVRFANRSIGMIHGHREERSGRWRALRRRLMGGSPREGLYKYVLEQFEGVDCIVFGHSHHPYVKVWNRVLLFNPGAVAPTRGLRPSVGILDVGERTISGRIVYL
jgi:putative phosphoesterase